MTENEGNDKKIEGSNPKKKLNVVTFTGAAGLLGLAVSFAIFTFKSHKQKSKKKGTLSLSLALVFLSLPLAWFRNLRIQISQCSYSLEI